jgi:hypothetical protein
MPGRRMNWEKANRRERTADSSITETTEKFRAEQRIGGGMQSAWRGKVNLGWTPYYAGARLRALGCWFNPASRTLWAPRELLQQCRRIVAEEMRKKIIEEHKEVK